MDEYAREELSSIKYSLNWVISELEDVSRGIRGDFKGIGNEICSDTIDNVLQQYYYVRKKLNNLDTSRVTDSYAATHSIGGGTHG